MQPKQLEMFHVERPPERGRTIKAISLWEPWASAMALGLKCNETRGWPTNHRGDLLICAAQRRMEADELRVYHEWVRPFAGDGYVIPYGCAVAVVELHDCVATSRIATTAREFALGNYEHGRFAWVTKNLRRLQPPVAIKGRQGFFDVPEWMMLPAINSAVGTTAPAAAAAAAVVYVDELFTAESSNAQARRVGKHHGHQWCHMWSESLDALHAMARNIGMQRAWFQDRPGFPHYDLVPTKRTLAIRHGAVVKPLREWLMEKKEAHG